MQTGRQVARAAGSPHPAVRIDARLTSCSPRLSVFIYCGLQHAKLKPQRRMDAAAHTVPTKPATAVTTK